jgi:antirestriction protein ArdC
MCIRQTITDKIISIMEQGPGTSGLSWTGSNGHGLPRNAKTGQEYRGVNVLLLWAEAAEKGYSSNLWLTYRQAQELGGQVRKSEKSVICVYFQKVEKESESEQDEKNSYAMVKPFFLFNVAQVDGLPSGMTTPAVASDFNPIEAAEDFLAMTQATIRHGFDSAFYAPHRDEICLPNRERFTSVANFHATAFHEASHWTGHESRLNRAFSKRFGDDSYAVEELVAELSAAFTMGHLGLVDGTIELHADYLQSWLKCLKADKQAIFTAAAQAGKAFDFLVARQSAATP